MLRINGSNSRMTAMVRCPEFPCICPMFLGDNGKKNPLFSVLHSLLNLAPICLVRPAIGDVGAKDEIVDLLCDTGCYCAAKRFCCLMALHSCAVCTRTRE